MSLTLSYRPLSLDSRILSRARLQQHFPLPEREERMEMFSRNHYVKHMKKETIRQLSCFTEGFSHREISTAIKVAIQNGPMKQLLEANHFKKVDGNAELYRACTCTEQNCGYPMNHSDLPINKIGIPDIEEEDLISAIRALKPTHLQEIVFENKKFANSEEIEIKKNPVCLPYNSDIEFCYSPQKEFNMKEGSDDEKYILKSSLICCSIGIFAIILLIVLIYY